MKNRKFHINRLLCSNFLYFRPEGIALKKGTIIYPIRCHSTNDFIGKLEKKVQIIYSTLPDSSVLKHPDSLATYRITISSTDVIKTLYALKNPSNVEISHFFLVRRTRSPLRSNEHSWYILFFK